MKTEMKAVMMTSLHLSAAGLCCFSEASRRCGAGRSKDNEKADAFVGEKTKDNVQMGRCCLVCGEGSWS